LIFYQSSRYGVFNFTGTFFWEFPEKKLLITYQVMDFFSNLYFGLTYQELFIYMKNTKSVMKTHFLCCWVKICNSYSTFGIYLVHFVFKCQKVLKMSIIDVSCIWANFTNWWKHVFLTTFVSLISEKQPYANHFCLQITVTGKNLHFGSIMEKMVNFRKKNQYS
jgi:hypothetical protein